MIGNLDSSASRIDLTGVIQGSAIAGAPSPASPVNVTCRILNSKGELITGTLSLAQESTTEKWDVAFTPEASVASKLTSVGALSLGKLTFAPNGSIAQNNMVPLTLNYAATDGAAPQSIAVDPGNLQIRTDVNSTQVGFSSPLSSDPSGAALPGGDVGIIYAGGYSMPVTFFDSTGVEHTGALTFQRDLDAQQGVGVGSNIPITWRVLFTDADPLILDDKSGVGAGAGPIPIDLGTIGFDQAGTLVAADLYPLQLEYTNGAARSTLTLDPGKLPGGTQPGLTQFSTASSASASLDPPVAS